MADSKSEDVSAFAAALQQARQAKSLSVSDAARALLLSENQIAGLERDDFGAFYGATYVDRAARRYAELLGVDIGLRGEVPPEPAPALTPVHHLKAQAPKGVFTPWVITFLGAAIAVGVGAFVMVVPRQGSAPSLPEPVPPTLVHAPVIAPVDQPTTLTEVDGSTVADAAPLPPPVPEPIAASARNVPDDLDHRFYLVVTSDVVIQARDANGAVLLSGTQVPNPGQRVLGFPPFSVVVSDENAVELYYRGQRIRSGPLVYEGISLSVAR